MKGFGKRMEKNLDLGNLYRMCSTLGLVFFTGIFTMYSPPGAHAVKEVNGIKIKKKKKEGTTEQHSACDVM